MTNEHAQSSSIPPPPQEIDLLSLEALNTTRGCLVHRLFARIVRLGRGREPLLVSVYIICVALTLVPLLIGAAVSPLSLANPIEEHRLPFLRDWNMLFMYLVSFPCLMILTVTDQHVLSTSLKSVQFDGTLTISNINATPLVIRWQRRFFLTNLASHAVGALLGVLMAYYCYVAYIPKSVGFWIAIDGRLLPVGFIFLYCIFLFYSLVPVYVFRNVAIALLFKDIVSHSQLRLLPLHPDKSGGLRPVGRLGLRNQYVLTLFGLNVVLLVITSVHYLRVPNSLYGLMVAAVIAYLVLGPLVFVGPLLAFRGGMLRTKSELMGEVAKRLRVELQRLRGQLQSGSISKEDEELVDRLRKIGALVDELPVWPFDATTVRKFLVAYIVPMLGSLVFPAIQTILYYSTIRTP